MNPKDLVGAKKTPLGVVPPALMIGAAEAMQTGATKYGPFNYRENKVQAVTYYEAILRHLFAWFDGQDMAEDTGVHHLRHVAAGVGILLDAVTAGNLIDNRPVKGPAADMLRAQDKSVAPPAALASWAVEADKPVASDAPVVGTKFLCGHVFGEEPDGCGTAIHWSRVNGVELKPSDSGDMIAICEDAGNHIPGLHFLTCPDYS